jgi:PAS domain S-box-containing protein
MVVLHNTYNFTSNSRIKLLAVISIVALLISNLLVIQYFITQKKIDDRVVNTARKQRTWSQNIARLIFEDNPANKSILSSRIMEWKSNHDALTGVYRASNIPLIVDNKIRHDLQALSVPMSQLNRFANDLIAGNRLSQDQKSLLSKSSDDVLIGMDSIINEYQVAAEAKSLRIIYYMAGLIILTIAILLGEFLFLFAPLFRNLRSINQQQDLIINGITAGIWDWNIKTNERWWSPAFYHLLGYENLEIKPAQVTFMDLLHAADRERVSAAIQEHLQNHKPYKLPVRIRTKDGSYKWFETAGKAIQNDKGENLRMAGSIIDIDLQHTIQLELEKNQVLIQEVGEMAKIGGWEIDLKTMKPYWSKAVYDIHDLPYDQEPDVENAFEFYEEGYRDMARETLDRAIKRKESYQYEYRFVTAKGKKIWVRVMGKPVLDEEGNVIALRGVMQNIDEEKEAQKKLSLLHNELFGIYTATTDVSIISVDLRGIIVHFNKGAQNMLGYSAVEVIGKQTPAIFHLPEEIKKRAEELSVQLGRKIEGIDVFTQLVKQDTPDQHEWTYVRKDGTQFCVQLVMTGVKDDHNNIKGFLGIATDITKIKDAEKALKESERKYRRIFQNVQDVFYMTDQNGIVTEISPSIEEYSGYKIETIIGHPVTDFYYNIEDREKLVKAITENGSVIDFEVRLKTNDGQMRFASVNAKLVVENGVVGTEGSMRDITLRKLHGEELEALNVKLKALNEQKNKLLSVIAHDLRNPIAGCLSLINLAFMDIDASTKEDLTQYLGLMRDATSNANELLEELLQWAKSQFNSVNFEAVKIDDLAEIVASCMNKVKPLAESKNIEIIENIPDNLTLFADKNMLETIIRNLATNAVKYTNNGGIISISAEKFTESVLFKVTDTGIGISADRIEQLFDKSSDYTSFGTAGEKGIGLGLDLSFDFVEKHGGKIWVESIIGKGSTFYFTIPNAPPVKK